MTDGFEKYLQILEDLEQLSSNDTLDAKLKQHLNETLVTKKRDTIKKLIKMMQINNRMETFVKKYQS